MNILNKIIGFFKWLFGKTKHVVPAYDFEEYEDSQIAIVVKSGKYSGSKFLISKISITEPDDKKGPLTLQYTYAIIGEDADKVQANDYTEMVGNIIVDILGKDENGGIFSENNQSSSSTESNDE